MSFVEHLLKFIMERGWLPTIESRAFEYAIYKHSASQHAIISLGKAAR